MKQAFNLLDHFRYVFRVISGLQGECANNLPNSLFFSAKCLQFYWSTTEITTERHSTANRKTSKKILLSTREIRDTVKANHITNSYRQNAECSGKISHLKPLIDQAPILECHFSGTCISF